MSPHFWIGAQVLLDVLMVALLLWFLRTFSGRETAWRNHEQAIERAEALLGEMREIGLSLDANLKEKKEIGSRIMAQLDLSLQKAEEAYGRISDLLPEVTRAHSTPALESRDPEKTRHSVYALLAKGLRKEEIAKHLGVSLGEIELMMKLWPPKETR